MLNFKWMLFRSIIKFHRSAIRNIKCVHMILDDHILNCSNFDYIIGHIPKQSSIVFGNFWLCIYIHMIFGIKITNTKIIENIIQILANELKWQYLKISVILHSTIHGNGVFKYYFENHIYSNLSAKKSFHLK